MFLTIFLLLILKLYWKSIKSARKSTFILNLIKGDNKWLSPINNNSPDLFSKIRK